MAVSKAITWGKASTGQLMEEKKSGCMTENRPHILQLLVLQHEKVVWVGGEGPAIVVSNNICPQSGDEKTWESVLPLLVARMHWHTLLAVRATLVILW